MATNIPVSVKFGMPKTVSKPTIIYVATAKLDLSADTSWLVDCTQISSNIDQFPVLGIFVDNSQNSNPLFITSGGPIFQPIVIPAAAQARLPVEGGQPEQFVVSTQNKISGAIITIQVLNYTPEPIVWYPGGVSGRQDISCGFAHGSVLPVETDSLPGLAAALLLGATRALVIVEGSDFMWRDDGTPASATFGMPQYAGQSFTFNSNISLITYATRAGGTGDIYVTYYR